MQNKVGKISVIIPFYNGASFLREAIESVLSQEYSNIQIIAVDDGSTDQSVEQILSINDSRIKIIKQQNAGAAEARNTGVQAASGDYLCFLDADDVWDKNKLKLQIQALEENEGVNMIFGQVKEFNDASVLKNISFIPEEKTFVGYSPIALLISKSDFNKVGAFQGKYKVAEFIDWYDRAKQLGLKEIVLPQIVAYRRIHSGNVDRLHRPDVKQYVAVLKEALDRRRKNQQEQ